MVVELNRMIWTTYLLGIEYILDIDNINSNKYTVVRLVSVVCLVSVVVNNKRVSFYPSAMLTTVVCNQLSFWYTLVLPYTENLQF